MKWHIPLFCQKPPPRLFFYQIYHSPPLPDLLELFLAFQIAHKIVCQINNNPYLPFQLVERLKNNLTKRRGSFGISHTKPLARVLSLPLARGALIVSVAHRVGLGLSAARV
jgi:hypothetical protein